MSTGDAHSSTNHDLPVELARVAADEVTGGPDVPFHPGIEDYYSKMVSEWTKNGCAVICDNWTDGEGRNLLAFSVACSKGVFFLKYMDVSGHADDPRYLFRCIEEVVLEVGVKNVVQVITESRKSYEFAGKLLMERYPSLFWSPCVLHCLNQILVDFSQQDWVRSVLEQADVITSFVYGNDWVLNFMKSKFTGGADLTRPRVAGHAAIFLALRSIVGQEVNLKRMTCHLDWLSVSLHARESDVKSMVSVLFQAKFWKAAREAVSVTEPLLRVLRLVDGDMPAIGYIYEAMENAKLKIKAYYGFAAAEKYEQIRKIIDERWCIHLLPLATSAAFLNPSFLFIPTIKKDTVMRDGHHTTLWRMATREERREIRKEQVVYIHVEGAFGNESTLKGRTLDSPGHWWATYGHEIPTLQKFAMRILSQPCSSYGRIWVWKVIAEMQCRGQRRVHRPDDEQMMVYKQCNLLLQAVEKRKDGAQSRRAVHIEEVDLNSKWPSESDVALFDS